MGKITAKTTIDASPERVWEVLADFGGISQAAPHLTGSRLTSDEVAGVGASRHCDLAMPGVATEEVITRWDIGTGHGVDVAKKGMPMKHMHADFKERAETGAMIGKDTKVPLAAVEVG